MDKQAMQDAAPADTHTGKRPAKGSGISLPRHPPAHVRAWAGEAGGRTGPGLRPTRAHARARPVGQAW